MAITIQLVINVLTQEIMVCVDQFLASVYSGLDPNNRL